MASTSDKLSATRNAARPVSTTVSTGRSTGGSTLACASLTGWPVVSKVHFVTYQIDSNSNPVAGTQLDCYGIVSGNNINSFTVVDGSDNGNSIGDVVEMLPTAAWGQGLYDWGTTEHTTTGTHGAVTATSLTASGAVTAAAIVNNGALTQTGVATFTAVPVLPASTITTANIQDSAVDYSKLATGAVVQVVNTISGAVATGTTTLPVDDTIPQSSEGTQFMTLAITPKSATNILVIEVLAQLATSADVTIGGALFQDSTAGALAGMPVRSPGAATAFTMSIRHTMAAGTTSATTFKFRAGGNSATTVTFNGSGGARLFGGVTISSMVVWEYKA